MALIVACIITLCPQTRIKYEHVSLADYGIPLQVKILSELAALHASERHASHFASTVGWKPDSPPALLPKRVENFPSFLITFAQHGMSVRSFAVQTGLDSHMRISAGSRQHPKMHLY